MRNILVLILAGVWMCVSSTPEAFALPANGAGAAVVRDTDPLPVHEARWGCFNRYTGRLKYWGTCHRHIVYRPRVYCYNRYTGRFLHWGSCWR